MNSPAIRSSHSDIPLWQRRWAGPAVVAATFVALLIWTWQRLADVLVDFGVQPYVPWQLTQGKVLYRDIAHYTGPVSVYYNALAFRIFGVNLRVLEIANLPILIATVIIIYFLARVLGGRLCATITSVSFLVLFAFAHISVAGNYNFVTPYEYEYTHATLLCFGCVLFLYRLMQHRRWIDAAAAGFLAGIVFLTRAEFFVAIAAAAVAGFILLAVGNPRISLRHLIVFILFALIPPVVAILALHFAMPWRTAIHGALGMWPALLAGHVSAQRFYLHSMGLDDLRRSLRLMAVWTAAWSIPIAGFTAWAIRPTRGRKTPTLLIALFIGATYAGWQWKHVDWASMFRPLPLVAGAVAIISSVQYLRSRSPRAALSAMLGVLSLVLLGKVFFYSRIIHYGCWLAMPATLLLVIALFGWIPSAIGRRGGSAAGFAAGLGGVWVVVLAVHLAISGAAMRQLTVSVGRGPDQFWADAARGDAVNNAVLVAEQIPADKTLACFPEGIMINYLARRRTSTRYVNFNPPDLLLFGENQMLQSLAQSPPDFIFMVHKDTSEFGERFFGEDYGRNINRWINANYQEEPLPMLDLGAEPLRDTKFGIRLFVPRNLGDQRRLIYGPAGGDGDSKYSFAAASMSWNE